MRTLFLAFALLSLAPLALARDLTDREAQLARNLGLTPIEITLPQGDIMVLAGDGWCLVDPDDDGLLPWLAPVALSALDGLPGGQQAATAGASHCFVKVIPSYSGGTPTILSFSATVTGHGSTLAAAVSSYQAQMAGMAGNGWMAVPCGPPNPTT